MAVAWSPRTTGGRAGRHGWVGLELTIIDESASTVTVRIDTYVASSTNVKDHNNLFKYSGDFINASRSYNLTGVYGHDFGKLVKSDTVTVARPNWGSSYLSQSVEMHNVDDWGGSGGAATAYITIKDGLGHTETPTPSKPSYIGAYPKNREPSNFKAVYKPEQKGIYLSWKNNASYKYQFIDLQRSANGGSYTDIETFYNTNSATSYLDTSVKPGTTYKYRIRGLEEQYYFGDGTLSNVEETTPLAPVQVTAKLTGARQVTVSWKAGDQTNVVGFIVYKSTKPNDPSPEKLHTTGREFSYVDTKAAGENIYYSVQAFNGTADSVLIYSPLGYAQSPISAISPPAEPKIISQPGRYVSMDDFSTPGKAPTIEFEHSSQDGSEQSAAQVEVTIDYGTRQDKKTYSLTTERRYRLSQAPTSPAAISVRIRTKGLHNSYSPWSKAITFNVEHSPQLIFSAPETNNKLYENTPIPIKFDLGARRVIAPHFDLYAYNEETQTQGELLFSADTNDFELKPETYLPQSGASYIVLASARDQYALSARASRIFKTQYKQPARPRATVSTDINRLSAQIVVEFQNVEGREKTAYCTVARIDRNGREVIAKRVDNNQVISDIFAPLNTVYTYEVIATTNTGATDTAVVTHFIKAPGVFALNFGEGQEELAQLSANAARGTNAELEQEMISYLGRVRPVLYSGQAVTETIQLSGSITSEQDILDWTRARLWAGKCIYRDCYGYRASVAAQISSQEPPGFRVENIDATLTVIDD